MIESTQKCRPGRLRSIGIHLNMTQRGNAAGVNGHSWGWPGAILYFFFQKMNQMEQSLTPAATLPPTHPPASNYGASEGGGRSLNPPPPSSPY